MMTYPKMMILSILQVCLVTVTGFQQKPDELTVSVAIFSGRPDPVWQLSSSNPAQATQYTTIKAMLASTDKDKKFYPAQMPARLGFKGFLVQEGKNEPYLIIGPKTKKLQLQLLASMPLDLPGNSSLREDNIKEVKEAVNSGLIKAEDVPQPSASTLRSKRAAPPYLPNEWFMNRKIRECNNCYNYANNVRTYTFAQPGQATGLDFNLANPLSVLASAVSDGLAVVAPDPPHPLVLPNPGPNHHYVALVVAPDTPYRQGDFHWYRLDGQFNNGRWSHKPGKCIPNNRDHNGRYITDPRLAAMGPYHFVAFMTTNPNAVNINTGVYGAGCDPNQV